MAVLAAQYLDRGLRYLDARISRDSAERYARHVSVVMLVICQFVMPPLAAVGVMFSGCPSVCAYYSIHLHHLYTCVLGLRHSPTSFPPTSSFAL